MLAFFDTETTGFVKPNKDLADQPHCCQLAILLTDDDGNEINSYEAIIKPGEDEPFFYQIPERVADIHGITTERAILEGIPLPEAIEKFHAIVSRADTLVAHNISFDRIVMAAAYWRVGNPAFIYPSLATHLCTMLSATDIVCIPKTRGSGYKWPKLLESHLHFFNEGFEDAHSAMADVRACKRVYFALKEAGAFEENYDED